MFEMSVSGKQLISLFASARKQDLSGVSSSGENLQVNWGNWLWEDIPNDMVPSM